MKRIGIVICLSILLLTASISQAVTVKGISTLNNIGTPATVTDAIITYDSSVPTGTGDQMTHIKFDGVATNCLNGTGMWIACAAGDVISATTITNNAIVRGDGGAKGVQESGVTISDADLITVPDTDATSGILFPLRNDAANPTIAFGDGDTGFFELSDDAIYISAGGAIKYVINGTNIQGYGGGGGVRTGGGSYTVPNLYPHSGDTNTGIGNGSADQLSLIAGGVEQSRFQVSGNHQINSTLDEATGDEDALRIEYTTNKASSGDDTGLVINQTDTVSPGTSLLIDAQVGGSSRFSVNNTGKFLKIGPEAVTSGTLTMSTGYSVFVLQAYNDTILQTDRSTNIIRIGYDVDFTITSFGHRNNDIILQNDKPQGDTVAKSLSLVGAPAFPTSVTNLDGSNVYITAGDGASASAGDADGGTVNIQGGKGYGTGVAGNVAVISDLDTATNNEEVFVIKGEVDKATSGDTRMIYASPKYTSAPGTDYLMDLGTNSATDGALGTHTPLMLVDNTGLIQVAEGKGLQSIGNGLVIGDGSNSIANVSVDYSGAGTVGTTGFFIGNRLTSHNAMQIRKSAITLGRTAGNFNLEYVTHIGDTATQSLSITGQSAKVADDTLTNMDGGAVNITGGAGASGETGDADGGNVNLQGGKGYGTGASGQVAVISDLDTATNDEEVFVIKGEVDKATSGDTRMIYVSPKYTTEPGTDYLMDLGTNSATDGALGTHTSRANIDNAGKLTLVNGVDTVTITPTNTYDTEIKANYGLKLESTSSDVNVRGNRTANTGTDRMALGADGLKFGRDVGNRSISSMPELTDAVPATFSIIGQGAKEADDTLTNMDGGAVNITGGAGATGETGDADGGNVTIAGGTGYGTGDDGSVIVGAGGFVPLKVTADPCGGMPEGSIFYNDTSNYMCYCDGTNDVQMHDPTTACF